MARMSHGQYFEGFSYGPIGPCYGTLESGVVTMVCKVLGSRLGSHTRGPT